MGVHRIIIHHQNKSCLSLSICLPVLLWCDPFHLPVFKAGVNQRLDGCCTDRNPVSTVTLSPKHERLRVMLFPRQDTGISYQNLQMYPINKAQKGQTLL